jgi:tRNA A37 threonylcarbamoyladenosine modification protein TsaB
MTATRDPKTAVLLVDTSAPSEVCLALLDAAGARTAVRRVPVEKMATIHRTVDALVARRNLTGILVTEGPGGFSHVRRGITLANTLGFAWQLPLAAVRSGEGGATASDCADALRLLSIDPRSCIIPAYGQEPTITMRKTAS